MSKPVSMARKLARMRIIALPLTHDPSKATFYHFQTPSPSGPVTPNLLKRVTGKVASLWAGFGKAPEGSWKFRTFTYGERLMDRIEFEELSLKSMDPSLGPKLSNLARPGVEIEKRDPPIPLLYPTMAGRSRSPILNLRDLLRKRTPTHRKGFYLWLAVSPLTAPFMIIPIIPNLPFFFCAWRSWHHYRAFKASSYLESLIERGAIESQHSAALDRIYEQYGPRKYESESEEGSNISLLKKEAVPEIVLLFELPSTAEAELYRALDQTSTRIHQAAP